MGCNQPRDYVSIGRDKEICEAFGHAEERRQWKGEQIVMARSLNITVGGEQARIRCSVTGDVLNIMASKCFAEYVKLMKLATEGKCDMPVPAGSEQARPPLEPGQPVRPPLCLKDMGAFNTDMGYRFPEDADKHIKAFLAGEDVPKTFDSVPPEPGEAKMFTLEEVQAIAADVLKQGMEAAGHIAKPVAELLVAGDGKTYAKGQLFDTAEEAAYEVSSGDDDD